MHNMCMREAKALGICADSPEPSLLIAAIDKGRRSKFIMLVPWVHIYNFVNREVTAHICGAKINALSQNMRELYITRIKGLLYMYSQ